jgi:hypothetical protein
MASLHVIGGYNGIEPLTTVEVYIPATNRWRTMTGMPTARSLVGGAIDGKLYAVGGQGATLAVNQVYMP